jgi:O-antigen ligase
MAQQGADVLGASVVETLDGRWLRAYGSFPHPNMLGGWLVLGLASIISLLTQANSKQPTGDKKKKFLFTINYLLLTILVFGLLTTFSRSAWLAFGVVLVAVILIRPGRSEDPMDIRRTVPKQWDSSASPQNDGFKLLALTILTIATFAALFPQPFLTRINADNRLEYKSTSERQASLSEGWKIIKKHPILGVGVGNYGLAVHRDIDSTKPSYYYQPTHNVFLLIWAELGLVGLLLIAYCLYLIAFKNRETLLYIGMLLLPLLIIATLDHYLWSLYSGLMIGAVYLANISRK